MMPQRNQQRRQSGLKSGGRGSGSKKFRFLQANFRKNLITFFRQFYKRISISENFDFFRQLKKTIFQAKNCLFTATSGQIILFLFKSNRFRTSGVARQLCARGRAMKLAPPAPSLLFSNCKFSV